VSAKDALNRIAASKLARRRELARLSFAEKFRMVVEMNALAAQARAAARTESE
jgi:hypothetical protein